MGNNKLVISTGRTCEGLGLEQGTLSHTPVRSTCLSAQRTRESYPAWRHVHMTRFSWKLKDKTIFPQKTLTEIQMEKCVKLQRKCKILFVKWFVYISYFILLKLLSMLYKQYSFFIVQIRKVAKGCLCWCWFLNLFFFPPHSQHEELPRPGMEPSPQQWAEPEWWQCGVLNPLHHGGIPVSSLIL